MAKLTDWRATESETHAPGMDVAERQFLMRLVLGLLSAEESLEFDRVERLTRRRQRIERLMPVLDDRVKRDLRNIRRLIPEIGRGVAEELFVDAARTALEAKIASSENEPDLSPTESDVTAAENHARDAVAARSALEERQSSLVTRVEQCEESISDWSAKAIEARNDEAQGRFRPTSKYCGAPILEAEASGCELAKRYHTISLSSVILSSSFSAEETRARKEKEIAEAAVSELKKEVEEARRREMAATESLDTMKRIRERNLITRERSRAQLDDGLFYAKRASEAMKNLSLRRTNRDRLKREIERSLRTQRRIRKDVEDDRINFSSLFDFMIQTVLGTDVGGSVKFSGRDLSLHADQSGERTSAAIESIKVVCFDLAALTWSIEGRGWHPGFLIHDSPREADMQSSIYRCFFKIARILESLDYGGLKPPFQYIITTTEPPPTDMQKDQWLICDPLDASIPEKRLLKLNL